MSDVYYIMCYISWTGPYVLRVRVHTRANQTARVTWFNDWPRNNYY